jgi:GT2 family glycosyltransferase
MLASVIISTSNRAAALAATLEALAQQDISASEYEVVVVDDGSTDDTPRVLSELAVPYTLRAFRLPSNRGVSAGRNVGLRNARGEYIVLLSDDLVVPPNFISEHVATLRRLPNTWVVGGFSQLGELTKTPFGRFLANLEESFERARMGALVDGHLIEMTAVTARNLSLPRTDLDRVGLFDEQFRVTCEDQDLEHRAAAHGIQFVYNAKLECVHNDQSADLKRYCFFQRRGARDTVRLARKYPEVHSQSPIIRRNDYVTRADDVGLVARKLARAALARPAPTWLVERLIARSERAALPDPVLHRLYRVLIGSYIFRGIREGLREADGLNLTPRARCSRSAR